MVDGPNPDMFMESFRAELQSSVIRNCPLGKACLGCVISVTGMVDSEDPALLEGVRAIRRHKDCKTTPEAFDELSIEAGRRVIETSGIDIDIEAF